MLWEGRKGLGHEGVSDLRKRPLERMLPLSHVLCRLRLSAWCTFAFSAILFMRLPRTTGCPLLWVNTVLIKGTKADMGTLAMMLLYCHPGFLHLDFLYERQYSTMVIALTVSAMVDNLLDFSVSLFLHLQNA